MTAGDTDRPVPLLHGTDVLRVALAVLGLSIGLIVTAMFVYSVLVVLGYTGTNFFALPLLFLLESVAILGGIHFALIRRLEISWNDLGWVPVAPGWLGLATLASLGFYAALIAIQQVASAVLGGQPLDLLPQSATMFPRSALGLAASLAFGAFAVPIAEEFLFRGILYRWLRDRWSVTPAMVGSALLFALLHPPAAGAAPVIFVMGLALAYLFQRTGSLWPSMVLHGVNNAVGITWIYLAIWLGAG